MPLPSRQQTFAYESCRDLLEKLKREVDRYRSTASRDDADVAELKDIAFNASVTAWHLGDWVFNDLTAEQRERFGVKDTRDLQEHVSTSCRALYLCRYAATASKHWQVTRYPDPTVQTFVTAEPTWSIYLVDSDTRIAADQVFDEALHFRTQFIYGNEIAKNIGLNDGDGECST